MCDINKEKDEEDCNILLAQFICDDAIIEEDDIDEEEEKVSELIYYNSVKLGNICYLSDQFEINSDDGLLHYIGTTTKPTQPIGLKNYSYMFAARCHLETIDLSEWNMSEVEDTSYMFSYCKSLKDISSLTNWDTSNIRNMRHMFEYCPFLEDINALLNWNVCSVESMKFMFSHCESLTDISPLWKWFDKDLNKVSIFKGITAVVRYSIKDISCMFDMCNHLEDILPLKNWDVRTVKSFSFLFSGCIELKDVSPLKDWNVSFTSNYENMFNEVNFISHNKRLDKVNTYKNIDQSNKELNKRILKLYRQMIRSNITGEYFIEYDVKELLKYINDKNLVPFIPSYYMMCIFKLMNYSIIKNIEDITNKSKNIICYKFSYNKYSYCYCVDYEEYLLFKESLLHFKKYQFTDNIKTTLDLLNENSESIRISKELNDIYKY